MMDAQKKCLLTENDLPTTNNGYDAVAPTESGDVVTEVDVEIDNHNLETAVYHRRWYVLALYSLLAVTNAAVWNTWGPIAKASEDVFGWTDSQIELLTNWGNIMFVVSSAFFSWLTFSKGLRWAAIIGSILIATATGLRCISDSPSTATWLINIAHILNGLAGPVWASAPPVLSAAWFPAHQRTTATAITSMASYIGVAIGFIIVI